MVKGGIISGARLSLGTLRIAGFEDRAVVFPSLPWGFVRKWLKFRFLT